LDLLQAKGNNYSDQELVDRYKQSGETWFVGELFQRYTPLISALSWKYLKDPTETEDALMEVFEIIVKDLKQYEVNNFKTWLYSVTKHHCLKKIRKMQPQPVDAEQALKYIPDDNDPQSDPHRLETQLEQLKGAIENLTREQRQCIELFYLEEKSYKEVSSLTGYSLKEVKSYLQNGKRNLKGYMATRDE
jgi:RNA polymerase sigma-70 factor (ECF subfamily)